MKQKTKVYVGMDVHKGDRSSVGHRFARTPYGQRRTSMPHLNRRLLSMAVDTRNRL